MRRATIWRGAVLGWWTDIHEHGVLVDTRYYPTWQEALAAALHEVDPVSANPEPLEAP